MMPDNAHDIKTAYQKICAEISAPPEAKLEATPEAKLEATSEAKPITLLAVSKQVAAAQVRVLLECGHRHFGENRVQEAVQKWTPLKADYPAIELHLIGALQSNKVKEAAALFDVIETLDRPRLAAALARLRDSGVALPRLFVQVNTGNEAQKAGVALNEAGAFIEQCRHDYGLTIEGLMCLPPYDTPPAPHFMQLATLAQAHNIAHLSMGMSGDYGIAIACGADIIRIGTALFGSR